MEKPITSKRLPETDSIDELAKFWDAHDLTDFEDQLAEVDEVVFDCGPAIRLQLRADEARSLRQMAESKGLAESELVREWVLEKIHAS